MVHCLRIKFVNLRRHLRPTHSRYHPTDITGRDIASPFEPGKVMLSTSRVGIIGNPGPHEL